MIAAQWQCVHANNDFHFVRRCAEARLASSYLMSGRTQKRFHASKKGIKIFNVDLVHLNLLSCECSHSKWTPRDAVAALQRGLASSKIQHSPSGISLTCLLNSPDEIQRCENTTVLLFGPQIPLVAQNMVIDFLSRGMRFCHISVETFTYQTEA